MKKSIITDYPTPATELTIQVRYVSEHRLEQGIGAYFQVMRGPLHDEAFSSLTAAKQYARWLAKGYGGNVCLTVSAPSGSRAGARGFGYNYPSTFVASDYTMPDWQGWYQNATPSI